MLSQGVILGQLKAFWPYIFGLKTGEISYYIRKFTFKPNYGCQQKGWSVLFLFCNFWEIKLVIRSLFGKDGITANKEDHFEGYFHLDHDAWGIIYVLHKNKVILSNDWEMCVP